MRSLCLSDPIFLGPSASKTVAATTLETSIGSSSEANSSVNIRPVESKKSIVHPLDEIMEKINFKELSKLSSQDDGLEENFDYVSNYSEEDFTDVYGGVSYRSEYGWMA
jgi:hypothetical protein